MSLLDNTVLLILIVFNFAVTIASALLIYEAVTIEDSPSKDDIDRIKMYGYVLLVSVLLNFLAWIANVVKESRK